MPASEDPDSRIEREIDDQDLPPGRSADANPRAYSTRLPM